MKAAVLCPGPSLVPTFSVRESEYAVKIGVNRSVGAFACDYWALLDAAEAFEQAKPIGKPKIVSFIVSWNRLLAMDSPGPLAAQHEFISFDEVAKTVPVVKITGKNYSMFAACAQAFVLGAKQIDCYGSDWEGEEDFDGKTWHNNNRKPDRWAIERSGFTSLCEWMAERGVVLQRIPARMQGDGAATESRTLEVAAL